MCLQFKNSLAIHSDESNDLSNELGQNHRDWLIKDVLEDEASSQGSQREVENAGACSLSSIPAASSGSLKMKETPRSEKVRMSKTCEVEPERAA